MKYLYDISIDYPLIDSFFEIAGNDEAINTGDLIIPDCTPGPLYVEEGGLGRTYGQISHLLEPGVIYLFGQKTKAVEYNFKGRSISAFGAKLKTQNIFAAFGIAAQDLMMK